MAKITKDMTFGEVIEKYPESASIMMKYGLHCIGCHVATYETIEQGSLAHGMSEDELKQMLKELNDSV
jgi:hybrid cluster-associated redox disulfide protein